jgi:hypothetical protein
MATNRLRDTVLTHLASSQAENPLRAIGLTKEIFELGLNEEELYKFCRRRARDLFATFHEDVKKKTLRSAELQTKYSQAFTALKDRSTFDGFLREFSQERTEERQEEVMLRRSLESERQISKSLRTDTSQLIGERDRMKAIQQNFGVYLRGMAADLRFTVADGWNDAASVTADGEVAVIEVVYESKKRRVAIPTPDLAERFHKGCKILRDLDILRSEYVASLEIYKISNGKIHFEKGETSPILGCVDPEGKGLLTRGRILGVMTGSVSFVEENLLAQIQPLLFALSFLIVPLQSKSYRILATTSKEAIAEVALKVTKPRNGLKGRISEIHILPQYLLLGFRVNQAGAH